MVVAVVVGGGWSSTAIEKGVARPTEAMDRRRSKRTSGGRCTSRDL